MRVYYQLPAEVDLYEASICREAIQKELNNEIVECIEIDFANCKFLDSSGAALLIWARTRCVEKMRLLNVPDNIRKMLTVYGVWDLICGS